MAMWTAEVNSNELINPFPASLDKDVSSKGDFLADYESFLTQFNVVRCPYVGVSADETGEILRVANALLDLSNWRAALLAATTVGSKVKEIDLHACTLHPQHIKDLALALNKIGSIKVIKIQYCSLNVSADNLPDYIEAMKALLADSTQIEYLSLKGNKLQNDFVVGFAHALSSNFRLATINFSFNDLGDQSVEAVCQAVKLLSNYKAFSFASNPISMDGFKSALNLAIGSASTAQDDTTVKANVKTIGDKNKSLKDTNKKRKKAGYVELSDYAAPADCVKTLDGKLWCSNVGVATIDFSRIEITSAIAKDLVQTLQDSTVNSPSNFALKVYFSGTNLDGVTKEVVSSQPSLVLL